MVENLSSRVLAIITLIWILGSAAVAPQTPAPGTGAESFAGGSLDEALRALQASGLKIFFTSNVVRPGMRVETEPTASDPRGRLDQLLAPHGLTSKVGPGDRLVGAANTRLPGRPRRRLGAAPRRHR